MFCLIYHFLPIFLRTRLRPILKHFPSVSCFPWNEVNISYLLDEVRRGRREEGGRKKSQRNLASE